MTKKINVQLKLTKTQQELIYLYTDESPFYKELNRVMREGSETEIISFRDYIFYLEETLSILEPFKGSVYRVIDRVLTDYRPGMNITWTSFSSATNDVDVALKFVKKKIQKEHFL